jgi:hypothetical protein
VFLEGTDLLICVSDTKKTKIQMGNTPNDKKAFLFIFLGTDSYSSHDPGLSHQPSHGTTSAPSKQQALKTKMDI